MDLTTHIDLMMDERNSMLWQWPRFQAMAAVIPAPNTEIIECRDPWPLEWAADYLDGNTPEEPPWLADITGAVERIGTPCFLRGDGASAKHDWANTCHLPEVGLVSTRVFAIAEWHMMMMGGPNLQGFAVRELLEPVGDMTAFTELPIGQERRYFVRDGVVECHHLYWPAEAVGDGQPNRHDWEAVLADLNAEGDEVPQLTKWAEAICTAFGGGYWSIDFMCDRAGRWWFIDAALGEVSWHPECPFAPADLDEGMESAFEDGGEQ